MFRRSGSSAYVHAGVSALVVLALLLATDELSHQLALQGAERIFDDCLGALLTALVVFIYERQRARAMARRLEVIESMNHHVRNALQVIAYTSYLSGRPEEISKLREAMDRVDWALKEILPGIEAGAERENARPWIN